MKYKSTLFSIAMLNLIATFSNGLFAQTHGGFQVGAAVGVLSGLTVTTGYRFSSNDYLGNIFAVRGEYSTLTFDIDSSSKIDRKQLEFFAKGKQIGALIDLYPFGSVWGLGNIRVSTGYYTGKFEIGENANKVFNNNIFVFNTQVYKLNGSVDIEGKIKSKVNGPYLGAGFDLALFYGLKLFTDFGIVFTSKPTIHANISGSGTIEHSGVQYNIASSAPQIQQFLHDMKKQYEKDYDEYLKKYFPIIRIGLLYRF